MDTPAERSTRTAGPPIRPAVREAGGSRRRRPSGEPPPLPHHLQTSGIRWLVAMVVLVVLAIVVFAGGLRGIAVDVAVADAAVVGRLAGIDLPGFQGLMRGLAALSSWWVLNILSYALVLVLLVLRRFRHMIIWLVLTTLLALIGMGILGPVAQRPRPFGVEIREGWGGWAMPAMQVTFFAVGLVAILYSLVPEGRWRNTGKWVVTALVALNALGRMALGADGPTDVLVGVALGVTIPLVAFRWFTPNEVFPITYRGGSGAHLDVGGARRRRSGAAWRTSSAWPSPRSSRSACRGRPAPPRCGSPSRATPRPSFSASCTPAATCPRTGGTSWAGSCCTAGWRTRSRSTPCAGWSSRRTTRCRRCRGPAGRRWRPG
jgi:membrane-associated phospholipid phosphatase